MQITAVQGDITRAAASTRSSTPPTRAMRGGGGVDGAIHRAGGPAILEDCVRRFPDAGSPPATPAGPPPATCPRGG